MNDKIIELYGLVDLVDYHMGHSVRNGGRIYKYKDQITFSNCDKEGELIDKDKTFIIGVFGNRWQSAVFTDQMLTDLPPEERDKAILFALRQLKSFLSTVPTP